MDRQGTVEIFRERLGEAMDRAGINRSGLARESGVDRSTVSQLLSPENDRLPRADTVAAIARHLQVSLDWLLGLTQQETLGADILKQSLKIQRRERAPVDEDLRQWHAEAAGYKIRYVPSNLPDQVKTEAVIEHEYGDSAAVRTDQALVRSRDRLAYSRRPETDIEICMPIQHLKAFARGQDIWQGLPDVDRLEQIRLIATLADELYPSMRWFLFDARMMYSAPITIFGPKRAAVYIGQMYFVFNTTEHIRVLTRHFDDLIRAAVIQPHETPAFASRLAEEIKA